MKSLPPLPQWITICEVGPRDGLQNESDPVATDVKVGFINRLSAAGLPIIEVSSFVRPGAIPQLSDAEAVVESIDRADGARYTALVPNAQGMRRASEGRLDGIAVFTAASETFSRRNTNASIDETLARFRPVLDEAQRQGLWRRGYVSTAFGCPYEGNVSAEAVVRVSRELVDMGVNQVVISDTIGVATPRQVEIVLRALQAYVALEALALHFHDTRGTGLANVLAGMQMGITTFDSSAGGLGGCPYAPGASGNIATEDLVYMLNGLGVETGVNLPAVVEATRYLARHTGKDVASRYVHALGSM